MPVMGKYNCYLPPAEFIFREGPTQSGLYQTQTIPGIGIEVLMFWPVLVLVLVLKIPVSQVLVLVLVLKN